MKEVDNLLLEHSDKEYAAFEKKLTPGLPEESFIGVRVPIIRKIAAQIAKQDICKDFLNELPHKWYDENLLHSVIISGIRKYDECLSCVEHFLPYVDNWAVCDTMRPKVFAKHKQELLPKIREWISSEKTYTCRFGLDMLMTYYLDEDFKKEYLELPAGVHSEEYYVNMMIAWYYATALAKQWDAAVPYVEERRLSPWVHRKTIQKAIESFRLTDERKEYLKSFR